MPDYGHCQYTSAHSQYKCDVLLDEDILSLRGLNGFDNSLVFEENGSTAEERSVLQERENRLSA